MANPEHLEILRRGVENWNKWSGELPLGTWPDLSGADLSEAKLDGANLHGAVLTNTKFVWSKLRGADVSEASLDGANLREADLTDADLSLSDLSGANLSRAILWRTKLTRTNLSNADLSDADLSDADLRVSDLAAANLTGANLLVADFSAANVEGTDFARATLDGTHFANLDLSRAKGLEDIFHEGPSTIGVDTIFKSGGRIPEIFLRGCGVPDEFLKFVREIQGHMSGFYSCFISYSTKDQDFAEKVYADLQSKGVRCWFAPEDLKIGEKFQDRIEKSIGEHDKLLLVLSANSIQSPWVEREVQAAFEREHKSDKLVLFPIRLDETVMGTLRAWAADIRRSRHIGEFNHWRDEESYKRALERLLRDLRAEAPTAAG